MTDIGPGDCVEATCSMIVGSNLTAGRSSYIIFPGDRAIVVALGKAESICTTCGQRNQPGLLLREYPLIGGVAWCHCEWRRRGPDRKTVVGWFADYLKAKPLPARRP